MLRRRNRGQSSGSHRARSQNGSNRNQTYNSHGPNVHIRGSANQVFERYQNLAREAQISGDRIAAESYFQYAEHYYRLYHSSIEREAELRRPSPSSASNSHSVAGQKSHVSGHLTADHREIQSAHATTKKTSLTGEESEAQTANTIMADDVTKDQSSEKVPQWLLQRSVSRNMARSRPSRRVRKKEPRDEPSPPEEQITSPD